MFKIKKEKIIMENTNEINQATEEEVLTFRHKIGNTTYIVGVHFSKTSKETIEDKIKRLVLSELEKQKCF